MKYFVKKYNRVQVIVASDDLSWCKKNIVYENIEYSDYNYAMDLAIISLSDHIIISRGTYS
jgi:predicted DNA binding CopG/RHH family protein